MYYTIIKSPVDPILLVSDGDCLTGLYLDEKKYSKKIEEHWKENKKIFKPTIEQLRAYFSSELQAFNIDINMQGTDFQKKVWSALNTIPYGETVSYKTIAETIQSPKAMRAVGLANGKNPMSIIVPCHRVIGANGSLTGYGGGLPRKKWLLAHEMKNSNQKYELI
ncbi:MAG: methylated-DNA--[protein]-cysteine S-methyltransferase [Cellvibrionaceae bacterium]